VLWLSPLALLAVWLVMCVSPWALVLLAVRSLCWRVPALALPLPAASSTLLLVRALRLAVTCLSLLALAGPVLAVR
jgi:hypothetical protein